MWCASIHETEIVHSFRIEVCLILKYDLLILNTSRDSEFILLIMRLYSGNWYNDAKKSRKKNGK